MLTAAQIEKAETVAEENLQPVLEITSVLEREALSHLSQAMFHMEQGKRSLARESIKQAIAKLNEAEIED